MSVVTKVTYGPNGIVSWEEADETFHIEYLNGKPITILSNGGPWLKEACSISYDAQGNFTGFSREIKTPMLPQILAMARGTVTATKTLTGGISIPALAQMTSGVTLSRSLSLIDSDQVLKCNSGSAIVLTIPNDVTALWDGLNSVGAYQAGVGAVSFAAGAGVTLRGTAPTPTQWRC